MMNPRTPRRSDSNPRGPRTTPRGVGRPPSKSDAVDSASAVPRLNMSRSRSSLALSRTKPSRRSTPNTQGGRPSGAFVSAATPRSARGDGTKRASRRSTSAIPSSPAKAGGEADQPLRPKMTPRSMSSLHLSRAAAHAVASVTTPRRTPRQHQQQPHQKQQRGTSTPRLMTPRTKSSPALRGRKGSNHKPSMHRLSLDEARAPELDPSLTSPAWQRDDAAAQARGSALGLPAEMYELGADGNMPTQHRKKSGSGILGMLKLKSRRSSRSAAPPSPPACPLPADLGRRESQGRSFKFRPLFAGDGRNRRSKSTSTTGSSDRDLSWWTGVYGGAPAAADKFSVDELSARLGAGAETQALWKTARDIAEGNFKPTHCSGLPDPQAFDAKALATYFPALLGSETGVSAFVRFCSENLALENILFYQAVDVVVDQPTPDAVRALRAEYIDETSASMVNISSDTRSAILAQASRMEMLGDIVGRELLAKLRAGQKEIFLVMERDLFSRFLTSPVHCDCWFAECDRAFAKFKKLHRPVPPPPDRPHLSFDGDAMTDEDEGEENGDGEGITPARFFSASYAASTPVSGSATRRAVLIPEGSDDEGEVSGSQSCRRRLGFSDAGAAFSPLDGPNSSPPSVPALPNLDRLKDVAGRVRASLSRGDLSRPCLLSSRSQSMRVAKREKEAVLAALLKNEEPEEIGRRDTLEAEASFAEFDEDPPFLRHQQRPGLGQRASSMRVARQRSVGSLTMPSMSTVRPGQRISMQDFDPIDKTLVDRRPAIEAARALVELGATTEERKASSRSIEVTTDALRKLTLRRSLREIQMADASDLRDLLRNNAHFGPSIKALSAALEEAETADPSPPPSPDAPKTPPPPNKKLSALVSRISSDYDPIVPDMTRPASLMASGINLSMSSSVPDTTMEEMMDAINEARRGSTDTLAEATTAREEMDDVLGRLRLLKTHIDAEA